MRIVQVANFVHSRSGGLRTAMRALAVEYRALGHDVVEIVPRLDGDVDDPRQPDHVGVQSVRLPLASGYRIVIRRAEIARILRDIVPDLVELHDKSTLYWLPAWCRENGIRCVVVSHERTDLVPEEFGMIGYPLRMAIGRARRVIQRDAGVIVCASAFAASEFKARDGGPRDNVHVVPLGVDLDLFESVVRPSSWSSPLRIVVCGRLSAEKGILSAVLGVMSAARVVDIELRLVGDGPLRATIERMSRGTPTGLRVTFIGHLGHRHEVARELGDADLVMNMGPRETFGLVTLEALASGTPVIVGSTGASVEIVNETCGRMSGPDPWDIREAILSILQSDRRQLSRAARALAEGFRWRSTAERILDLAWSSDSREALSNVV